jgi:hypothetical protein
MVARQQGENSANRHSTLATEMIKMTTISLPKTRRRNDMRQHIHKRNEASMTKMIEWVRDSEGVVRDDGVLASEFQGLSLSFKHYPFNIVLYILLHSNEIASNLNQI